MRCPPDRPRAPAPRAPARAALAVVAALAALAAPAAPAADDRIESLDLGALLDQPVDAVALHREGSSETAASVFVLTREDLRRFGARTLYGALRLVPGLFGYSDGLFPTIGVRGVGVLGDHTTRLLVLVDGHPLNNSVGIGQSYLWRDLPVPLDAVKRIEVVKGPVGSVYGPTAFLGVVNLVTLEPGDGATRVRAGLDAAASGVVGADGAAAVTFQRSGVDVLAAASATGGDGYAWRYPELATPVPGRPTPDSTTVRGADAFRAGNGYVRLTARGLALTGACGVSRAGMPSAPYTTLVGDTRTRLENRTCFAQARYERDLSEALTLSGRLSYDDFHFADAYAASDGMYRDLAYDRWASGELRATWRPAAGTLAIGGATVEVHRTLERVWADAYPTLTEDPVNGVGLGDLRTDFATLNAYALLEQRLHSTLVASAGATFHAHELFGSEVTPKLALVLTPGRDDVVKALWSRGFRAPTVAEAYYDDGTDFLPNPGLHPERVDSWEASWQRRLGDRATVTATGFLLHYTNLIRYVTVPAPGVASPDPADLAQWRQQPRNVGSTWVRGGELIARAGVGRWLQGHAGVSVQDVSANGRTNFPATSAVAAVATAPWQPLTLGASATYLARRAKDPGNLPAEGRPSVPPTLLLALTATLEVPGLRGLNVQVGVRNLLDAAAPFPTAGDAAPLTELPERPRTFRVALEYRFD